MTRSVCLTIMLALLLPLNLQAANPEESKTIVIQKANETILSSVAELYLDTQNDIDKSCMSTSTMLEDKVEYILRQNGFKILPPSEDSLDDSLKIRIFGYKTTGNICVAGVEVSINRYLLATIPFTKMDVEDQSRYGLTNFALVKKDVVISSPQGNFKEYLESNIESLVKLIILDIQRAKETTQKYYPELHRLIQKNLANP